MYGAEKQLEMLIGRKIEKIFMNEDFLKFETDLGKPIAFTVYGDCCSHSYFHDFIGVEKLLKGGRVTSVESVELEESDSKVKVNRHDGDECVRCYGYRIVVEDEKFGELTAVFSFRNSSNGYYGGSLEVANSDTEVAPQITTDVLEAVA